jgi:hypothetical protein
MVGAGGLLAGGRTFGVTFERVIWVLGEAVTEKRYQGDSAKGRVLIGFEHYSTFVSFCTQTSTEY